MPSNVTVESGSATALPCLATGAEIIYLWHNGNMSNMLAISDNSTHRMHLRNGTLTFNEVFVDDENIYVCVALDVNDPTNNISSNPAYLTGMSLSVCLLVCQYIIAQYYYVTEFVKGVLHTYPIL